MQLRLSRSLHGQAPLSGADWLRLRGSIRKAGKAGANRFGFSRLKGRTLKRGRYRLVAVARDAAGNQAPPKRVAFRVVG